METAMRNDVWYQYLLLPLEHLHLLTPALPAGAAGAASTYSFHKGLSGCLLCKPAKSNIALLARLSSASVALRRQYLMLVWHLSCVSTKPPGHRMAEPQDLSRLTTPITPSGWALALLHHVADCMVHAVPIPLSDDSER